MKNKGKCDNHPRVGAEVISTNHTTGQVRRFCLSCWHHHKYHELGLKPVHLKPTIIFEQADNPCTEDGLVSVQYVLEREDWILEVEKLPSKSVFLEKSGREVMLEELEADGNPVYHLDLGEKYVRCYRRQNGLWLEGVHWRGHCPALYYAEEVVPMATKGKDVKTTADKRKAEVPTAKLGPKSHVADPVPTKSGKKKADPRPCSCQCGQMTGGGYFFPGHDAKLKSLFGKVKKGEVKKGELKGPLAKMYALWEKDEKRPIKEIAAEVLG